MYEYLVMGKPIIATALKGIIREFSVQNGVVYVNHPEEFIPMADSLVKLNRLGELGEQARNFVKDYTWKKRADEFENSLNKLKGS
jgi:glycosyltransferase involved in cell wall biosynthesis